MTINGVERGPVVEADPAVPSRDRGERATARARIVTWVSRLVALGLLAAAALWAYQANVASNRPAMDMTMRVSAGTAAFPVSLAPVERSRITGTVTYTGSVAPFTEEDIYPRVTGRIVDMPVYPGDAVRAGQVVARLDDVELGSRVREAAAGVIAADATLAQMEADILAARHGVAQMEREVAMATADVTAAREGVAQMERELAMATADVAAAREGVAQMEREVAMSEAEASYQEPLLAREERLFRSGAVSQQDVESVRATAAMARARVQAARAKVDQAKAMVVSAQAKTEAARAKVDQAGAMEASALRKRDAMAAMAAQSRAQLRTAEVVRDYVTIVTPTGGYVVKRLVSPGVLVQPGMAILKIAQIDRVRLQANVGEKDLASIRVGSPATVTTTAPGQPPITVRVTAVFPFVDQGPRTAVVEAVVENTGRRFLPGQYVSMQFVTGEQADALSVPRGAVARMGAKATVWVVDGDRAQPREVTTGLEGPDRVEIVKGLAGPERVVARGHEGLYAGARVADVAGAPPAPAPDVHRGMPGMGGTGATPAPDAHRGMPGMGDTGAAPAPKASDGPKPGTPAAGKGGT
jgi:HlyD family secretion protein